MKVIFDSDLLGDDFFALHALVNNKNIELLAICSFGRITSALNRARMAQVFLEKEGAHGIPIIPGADRPIIQDPKKGCMYCNNELMGLLGEWNNEIKYSNPIVEDISASEYIASILRREKNVTLLCTGPLTNIALALSIAPEISNSISNAYIMAGVHFLQGNKSPVSESNVFNDADAAKIVFRTLNHITLIPLDVTLKYYIKESETGILNSKFFKDITLACCRSHIDRGDESIMPMHDYLAYLAMIDDRILKYEKCNVDVDITGNKTRGMLYISWDSDGKVEYAVDLDQSKCLEYYNNDFAGVNV